MKRYIKTNNLDITIDVVFELEPSSIVATTISPILNEEDELDVKALSDYIAFVESVEEIVEYYDFEMLDRYRSKSRPDTSFYYIYAHRSQIEQNNVPRMIRLRVSDHIQHLSDDHRKLIRDQLDSKSDKVKIPSTKRRQRYMPVEIVINNEVCDTYEEALEIVEDSIIKWLSDCGVDISQYEKFGTWRS